MQSFDKSVAEYTAQLDQTRTKTLKITNPNYDLGKVVKPGVYALQDETYQFWLHELASKQYKTVTPELREELLQYFGTVSSALFKINPKTQSRLAAELQDLRVLTGTDSLRAGVTAAAY